MKTEEDLFKEYLRDGLLLEAAQKAGVAALLLPGISIFNFGTAHSICLSASECKRPVGF
jgi:hypothetical protein